MNFNETMAVVYADYFIEHGEEGAVRFALTTNVALSVLNSLYPKFVNEGIEPMEKIPQIKKEKYWANACKYQDELGNRLKASRANYVLELITSTF